MMNIFTLKTLAILLLACSIDSVSAGTAGSEKKFEVMILGTFHFTGGGNDVVNEDIDDFLAPRRQSEIKAVLDRLESFAPDKIMLELDHEHEVEFNERYKAYQQGEHDLSVNERQQLGMRLAKRLGHDSLYAIDYSNFLDYRPALTAAQSLQQEALLAEHEAQIERTIAEVDSQKDLPLDARLIRLNSDFSNGNSFFLTLAQMGSVENVEGALSVLTWWERNLVMFTRTAQRAEVNDRILIIVGAGHKLILEQFFENAEGVRVVSPLPYLRDSR